MNDGCQYPFFMAVHKANLARQLQAAEEVEALKAQIEQQNQEMQELREIILAQGALDSVSLHSSPQPSTSTGYKKTKEEKEEALDPPCTACIHGTLHCLHLG